LLHRAAAVFRKIASQLAGVIARQADNRRPVIIVHPCQFDVGITRIDQQSRHDLIPTSPELNCLTPSAVSRRSSPISLTPRATPADHRTIRHLQADGQILLSVTLLPFGAK